MTEKAIIRKSVKVAKEEEKHHIVSEKELREQDKEFQHETKGLRRLFTSKFWRPVKTKKK
jgi:hypothetical protein